MKNVILPALLCLLAPSFAISQIDCIQCFHRNSPVSPNANNRILNGGFETHDCVPAWFQGSFCPSSNLYDCDIESWRCIGGGTNSYPIIFDTTLSVIPEGQYAAYFGNGNAFVCAEFSFDTSCLTRDGCEIGGFPDGLPTTLDGYGGPGGVSLEQTIDNLVVGEAYVLEFWAGGEPLQGLLLAPGVFAIDLGFGLTYLTCLPTEHPDGIGTTYLVRFRATSPTHTLSFINWGHMCIDCTELVIDNVRLYTLAELSPPFQDCMTAVDDHVVSNDIRVYPNPAEDVLHIDTPNNEMYSIAIMNAQGRKLWTQRSDVEINTGHLVGGIYFILIESKDRQVVKRFVKL